MRNVVFKRVYACLRVHETVRQSSDYWQDHVQWTSVTVHGTEKKKGVACYDSHADTSLRPGGLTNWPPSDGTRRVKRSTHQTSAIETRTCLTHWRWARVPGSLSSLRTVGEHILISRDTQSHASAVLFCGSEPIVHERSPFQTESTVSVHELLLAQRQQVSSSNPPSVLEMPRC